MCSFVSQSLYFVGSVLWKGEYSRMYLFPDNDSFEYCCIYAMPILSAFRCNLNRVVDYTKNNKLDNFFELRNIFLISFPGQFYGFVSTFAVELVLFSVAAFQFCCIVLRSFNMCVYIYWCQLQIWPSSVFQTYNL